MLRRTAAALFPTRRAGGALAVGAAVGAAAGATALGSSTGGCRCEADAAPTRRLKVLVTGFNDWKDLGEPPNLWRCRDNPSCRLLLGAACARPPLFKDGPLPRLLRSSELEVDWHFQTLTTQWQTAAGLDHLAYDVVINVGLGVYDGSKELRVEQGAHNSARYVTIVPQRRALRLHRVCTNSLAFWCMDTACSGADAAGYQPMSRVQEDSRPEVYAVESMRLLTGAVDGMMMAGYKVVAVDARPRNSYM
jgi:hypothetical protein